MFALLPRRLPCAPRLTRAFTTPNPLPATFMRGGTSKGILINRRHLPPSPADWPRIFQGLMGSPDPYGRQLNGMGGGISSLSKICVVGPLPTAVEGIDIEYTFVQIGVVDGILDLSGNCGNLTTAVGIFALDEKLCHIPDPDCRNATVTLRNTNTGKIVRTRFPVEGATGLAKLEEPEMAMAGVSGMGSRVLLEFLDPAGAKTGVLLPTCGARDVILLDDGTKVTLSCVDATNPTVFVSADTVFADPATFRMPQWPPGIFPRLEEIRTKAAARMGLNPTHQAQPKICIVAPPLPGTSTDLSAKALSMGALHKAIPSTVALCLAAAAVVKGSVVNGLPGIKEKVEGAEGDVEVRVAIPGGVVGVRARFEGEVVKGVAMERTARRLMRGEVYW